MSAYPFIVIEGIDGSGKGTQCQLLAERLAALNINCSSTHEPSNGICGKLLRKVLSGQEKLNETALALLFAADRADHIDKITELLKNQVVISDRHVLSSLAYNSADLSLDWVLTINNPVRIKRLPDLTILLDLDPQLAIERIQKRDLHLQHYEKVDTLIKVRNRYLEAIKHLPEPIHIISADKPSHEISQTIWQLIQPLINA